MQLWWEHREWTPDGQAQWEQAPMPGYTGVPSLVVLIGELVLRSGLLRNGLQAGSALGIGARGAEGLSTFAELTGESSIVDLLQVLQDFASGMFQ